MPFLRGKPVAVRTSTFNRVGWFSRRSRIAPIQFRVQSPRMWQDIDKQSSGSLTIYSSTVNGVVHSIPLGTLNHVNRFPMPAVYSRWTSRFWRDRVLILVVSIPEKSVLESLVSVIQYQEKHKQSKTKKNKKNNVTFPWLLTVTCSCSAIRKPGSRKRENRK